jgi:Putative zincin peptidase
MLDWLYRVYGYPHEALHALALRMIGRRAVAVTARYTDIPDDLTTAQYIFVAGLPALVFWGCAAAGLLLVMTPASGWALLVGIGLALFGVGGGLGTMGDLTLIAARLLERRFPNEDDSS